MTRLPTRRRTFAIAAAPALAMLAAAPVAHGTAIHALAACGDGAVLPLPALALPPAKKREQRQATLCAHAACPRELRLGRRHAPG